MTKAKFKSFWDKFGTLTILIFHDGMSVNRVSKILFDT